jgi:glycosyltransferase involved in cell wall biosynthesis
MGFRMSSSAGEVKYCVVVPAFREAGRIGEVVRRIRAHSPNVVVVDDGSPDDTAGEAEAAGAVVLRHEVNQGKGRALQTGMEYARRQGYEVAVTLDADGQHDPDEIPRFLEAYRRTAAPVLVGNRMSDVRDMPLVRKCTNWFMSWMLGRIMGQVVPDTQCGYRLYRTDIYPPITGASARFAAESEILLELAARGLTIGSVPIRTIYGTEKSKINPLTDTVRFFRMVRRFRRRAREVPGAPAG